MNAQQLGRCRGRRELLFRNSISSRPRKGAWSFPRGLLRCGEPESWHRRSTGVNFKTGLLLPGGALNSFCDQRCFETV